MTIKEIALAFGAGVAAVILAVVLFGREKAAEWVEAVWRFFSTGAFVMLLGVGVVAGCASDGGIVASPYADLFEFDTPWGVSGSGIPTVYLDGTKPMGFRDGPDGTQDIYSYYDDGTVKAAGRAAWALALA